jgi:hypothetical protein
LDYTAIRKKGELMEANRPWPVDDWGELKALHDDLVSVLHQLDALELHHAAAHVSTALEAMRRDLPRLVSSL